MVQINDEQARHLLGVLWASGGTIPARRLRAAHLPARPLRELVMAARDTVVSVGNAVDHGRALDIGDMTHTLRDVVEPVLTGTDVPHSYRSYVRRGVGLLFDLPGSTLLSDVLAVCEGTPIAEVHDLPERVYELARRSDINYAGNLRSAMRTALEQAVQNGVGFRLPATWLEVSAKSDVSGRLISALARLWVSQEPPTRRAIHDLTAVNPGSADRRFRFWGKQGLVLFRETHRGNEVAVVNLSNVDPEEVSMATVLAAVSARRPLSTSQHRQLFLALRRFLGLPERWQMNEREIAEAAASIPCKDLQRLPEDVFTHEMAADQSRNTAATLRSAVRKALMWAAEGGIIPMMWKDRIEDDWARIRDEWLPGGQGTLDGVKTSTRACHRTAWNWLREAATSLHGRAFSPADLQEHDVRDITVWLRKRGRFDHAGAVLAALNYAGRRGHGPRALSTSYESVLLGGEATHQTWEGLLQLFEEHGMGSEWREFATWYSVWATEDWVKLDLLDLPHRPKSRKLREGTLLGRAKAMRWVLGILQKDGWDLRELVPEDVFSFEIRRGGKGHGLKRAFALGQQLWRERHHVGDLTSPVGTSIRGYIVGAGLLAEALYRHHRHGSGHSVAQLEGEAATKKPRYGVDTAVEDRVQNRSQIEEQLWQAYTHSRAVGDRLMQEARAWGEGETVNTQKDLLRLLQMTPPAWYRTVVDAYLTMAKQSLDQDGKSRAHHELVRDAFLTGTLVSTGFRGEELIHLREDIHLPEWWADPDRHEPVPVKLRAVDRKNEKRHTGQLFPELVPAWLRAAYGESRSWLMRNLTPTENRFGLSPHEQHQHLLVDNRGLAFGCPAEDERGANRPRKKKIEKRVSRLRELWKNHAGRVAWEQCGLECPAEDGYFTLHTARNASAAGIYARYGPTAAANWLGDDEASVKGHYGCLLGTSITEELMRGALGVGAIGRRPESSIESLLEHLRAVGTSEETLTATLKGLLPP
jgi:hypothetical protein